MKKARKLLALSLVLVSVVAVAIPAFATTATINTNAVNIRTQPRTSATLVGQVANGTTVEVLGETEGSTVSNREGTVWLHVRVISCAPGSKHNINGRTGYVHSGYVSGYTPGNSHPQTMLEAFGSQNLEYGSRGNYVVNVQRVLNWANLLGAKQDDGIFGTDTENAVKRYQEMYWYDFADSPAETAHIDGIVGPKTKASMWEQFKDELQSSGIK